MKWLLRTRFVLAVAMLVAYVRMDSRPWYLTAWVVVLAFWLVTDLTTTLWPLKERH